MSVDLEVLDILVNCDFPPSSYLKFGGLSLYQLRRLSLEELNSRLSSCLPPCPCQGGSSLVARFISLLFSHQEEGGNSQEPCIEQCVPIPIHIKQEVKLEKVSAPPSLEDTGNNGNYPVQECSGARQEREICTGSVAPMDQEEGDDSDSDIEIIGEVRNVSIIRVVDAETKAKERVVHVTLDEEDEVTPTPRTSVLRRRNIPCPASKKVKIDTTNNPVASALMPTTPKPANVMKLGSFQLGESVEWNGNVKSVPWGMLEFRDLLHSACWEIADCFQLH